MRKKLRKRTGTCSKFWTGRTSLPRRVRAPFPEYSLRKPTLCRNLVFSRKIFPVLKEKQRNWRRTFRLQNRKKTIHRQTLRKSRQTLQKFWIQSRRPIRRIRNWRKKLRMDRRIVKKCPGPTVDFFRNRKRCPDKSMIWIRSCTV